MTSRSNFATFAVLCVAALTALPARRAGTRYTALVSTKIHNKIRMDTIHPSSRALSSLSGSVRRRFNAFFRVVLDAVDRAVDRVGLHQSRIIRHEHGLKVIRACSGTEPSIIVLRHKHDGHAIMHAAHKWVRFPYDHCCG